MRKFLIVRHLAVLAPSNNGWTKELNHVSWDGREPVYDIRTWNVDHSEYGKCVTLTSKELACLREALLAMQ